MKHYSVLLQETISNLNIKDDGLYVDATLGYGGHSKEILARLKRGFLFAFDQDIAAINYSNEFLKQFGSSYELINNNFVHLKKELNERHIDKVDGIIFDLGISSPQIDETERGFSFMKDAPLDMRMNTNQNFSAYNVINEYSEAELTNIFYLYGEEKLSKAISKKIVEKRPIKTTMELVKVINEAVGNKYFNLNHPERQIFQAIRIEVNSELSVLKDVLPDAIDILKPGGRICVITFHSLEDRIVKHIFKEYSEVNELVKGLPEIPLEYQPKIKLINKKPILPSDEELNENSRSKSAKLRVIERI